MNNVSDFFVHPLSKEPLLLDDNGNLYDSRKPKEILFKKQGSSYNFVLYDKDLDDLVYYDQCYHTSYKMRQSLTIEDIEKKWHEEAGFELLLHRIGDVCNKRVLLLGNGMSLKEFYFLVLGAHVVYTDLSIRAVQRMQDNFTQSDLADQYQNKIEFYAVDALHLPFRNKSFDVIYGCAIVHHIQNINLFFSEVNRCLNDGGKCIFFDDAYSPSWNIVKNTIFKPIQLWSHWKTGISPEDKLATMKGGFKSKEFEFLMSQYNFQRMMFERTSFFEYLVLRGFQKLDISFLKVLLPISRGIDNWLKRKTNFILRQGIRLVWGFEKK
jgi:SAM-dependent methyltransferase